MPIDNSQKDQNSNINSNIFDCNENVLDGEWSFDSEHSLIATEIGNNENDISRQDGSTIIVNRQFYQELNSTCDELKAQIKYLEGTIEEKNKENKKKHEKIEELERIIEEKNEEAEENQKKAKEFETSYDMVKREYNELVEKLERKERDAAETFDRFRVKVQFSEKQCELTEEKLKNIINKYNDMKTSGLELLEQKDLEIRKMQEEIFAQKENYEEQTEKLNVMELAVKLEKEKRIKYEEEVKIADRIAREEKDSRKQVEKKCLIQKTEKMALEEKVREMIEERVTVARKDCTVTKHDLLAQRIDVLQRQRDILVDSVYLVNIFI